MSRPAEMSFGLRQTQREQCPLTNNPLCRLQSRTHNSAKLWWRFSNEEHVRNNSVHAGDASLGGGTTARRYAGAKQWAGHFTEFAGAGRDSIATLDAAWR